MRIKQAIAPVLVTLLLLLFTWEAAKKIQGLIATGQPLAVGIGIAVALILIAIAYGILKEWQLAVTVSKMGRILSERGELPVDDLPRSPGGRIDRTSADAQFAELKRAVEENDSYWGAWYNLAFGYEASGDKKRARAALRKAAQLFKSSADRTTRI